MRTCSVFLAVGFASASLHAAPADVPHPFILWTKADANAIKAKIQTQPWAKARLQAMPASPKSEGNGAPFVNLFRYQVLGDEQAGKTERDYLLSFINAKLDMSGPDGQAYSRHYDNYLQALRYDVLYDSLAEAQRRDIEQTFRRFIQRELDKPYINTRISLLPNMQLPQRCAAQLMSVALRDEKLIRELWAAPSSFKWYVDDYLSDGSFYNEEFAKMASLIGELLLYCRGLERLGLNELGFGFTGKGGATMRSYVESYVRLGYPRTDIPGGLPRYERIAMGDARGSFLGVFQHANVPGFIPGLAAASNDIGKKGEAAVGPPNLWHSANMNGRDHRGAKVDKLNFPQWFEMLHAKHPEGPSAYFLAQMRRPDEDKYYPTLFWGLDPIEAKAAKPPGAPSYVAPERGFAMLRLNQTPAYWESPDPAVALQFATLYVHYTPDCFSLLGYHAFSRPVYLNRTISAGYNGGPWDFSVRGHCGVVVDGLQAQPIGQVPTRSDFSELANYAWASGSLKDPQLTYKGRGEVRSSDQPKTPATEVYPNIAMTRSLVLTRQYLFDVFAIADKSGADRQFHWLVHAPGLITDGNPWKDSGELQNTLMNVVPGDLPRNDGQDFGRQYRIPSGPDAPPADKSWIRISGEKRLDAGDRPVDITVTQSCILPDVAQSKLGRAWYDRKVGVRLRMLGAPNTTAFVFDTPTHYPPGTPRSPQGDPPGRPETGGVSIAIARRSPATLFVALHEPFENGAGRISDFRRIAQSDSAVAVALKGKDLDDRVMASTRQDVSKPVVLEGDGESFSFGAWAIVRIGNEAVEVRGDLAAMRLRTGAPRKLLVNGQEKPAAFSDGLLNWNR